MKKKQNLTKIALTGLLLASHLPADAQAEEGAEFKEVLLAVAGCGNGCAGKNSPHPPSSPLQQPTQKISQDSSSPEDSSLNDQESLSSSPTKKNSETHVADAGGDYAVPRSPATIGGGYSTLNHTSNSDPYYRSGTTYRTNTAPTGYTDYTARGSNIGGSYNIPSNGYGSSGEAGSWGAKTRTDIGRARVQEYNYNSYNTNRNFETSPNYQGDYLDQSFYSDTVAPYGAPSTEGYDKTYNQGPGYPYEAVSTSGVVTELQLKSLISPQAWNVYQQLDGEGKALALQLASQANFTNKDLAVREAYVRMQERRSYMQRQ